MLNGLFTLAQAQGLQDIDLRLPCAGKTSLEGHVQVLDFSVHPACHMACYCTPLEQRSAALHGYAHSYTPSLTLIEKSNDLAWSNSTAPTSASRAARTNQHIDNKHNSAALPCPLHCARDQLTPLRCTVPRDHYWRSGMLTSVNPALCSNRPALNRASVKPFFSCRRSCIRPVSRCQRIPTQAKLGGGDNQGSQICLTESMPYTGSSEVH